MKKEDEPFPIRAYCIKQLAAFYNCHRKTLKEWLRAFEAEIGPRRGYLYNPRQVRMIVQCIGTP
jgi:hypothetical protein